jgi:hypothetical protein
MFAIESAFVTTIVDREKHNNNAREWDLSAHATQHSNPTQQCAPQDTTEGRIFGLKMWNSKSAERDKSEYDILLVLLMLWMMD